MVRQEMKWKFIPVLLITWLAMIGALVAPVQAKAEGVLRVAIPASFNTLDPAKMKNINEYAFSFLIFNALTEIGPDMKVKPDLAERWETSSDLKTWTFYLRKGVRFHHGRELDAEDVIVTMKRILEPVTGSAARVNLLIVENMEVVDKYTARFTLKVPYAEFAEVLAERQAKIVPRDRIESLATAPIGTGPFKFKDFVPGDHATAVKNGDYFERGVPILDEVIVRFIPEGAAATTALEAGSIDVVYLVPQESIARLKSNPAIVVDEVATPTWDGIAMRNDQPPFNDVRVRQALFLVVDKPALTEVAVFGHGAPTHTPIAPSHPYFARDIAFKKPNPQAAKKLLEDAGYPNGIDLKLYIPAGRPARERLGIAFREMAKPAGLRIEVERVPWDKFVADIEGKAKFYVTGFFGRPTVDTALYPWYHSTGSWNRGLWFYENAKVDELLDRARRTPSDAERKQQYHEFQSLMVNEGPGMVVYVLNQVDAYRKDVKGLRSHPMAWLDLRRVTVSK